MNYSKIGKFIQEKRKSKNLTQKELAKKIGVTDNAISKWERGQGCPDVSILEILSKELECSILELLKGRNIENEIISITEADDYIKESITYSKEDIKNRVITICNRIIEVAIVCIVCFLVYLNVSQMIYIDKQYTYKVSNDEYKKIVNYISTLEENIDTIKNNQGNFSDDDYLKIVNNISDFYTDINKNKFLGYIKNKETFTYTINDIRILNLQAYFLGYERNILETLEKYTNSKSIELYKNLTTEAFFNNGELSRSIVTKTYFTYQYNLDNSNEYGENLYGVAVEDLGYMESNLKYELCKLIYLTEVVMEVGEISE